MKKTAKVTAWMKDDRLIETTNVILAKNIEEAEMAIYHTLAVNGVGVNDTRVVDYTIDDVDIITIVFRNGNAAKFPNDAYFAENAK